MRDPLLLLACLLTLRLNAAPDAAYPSAALVAEYHPAARPATGT